MHLQRGAHVARTVLRGIAFVVITANVLASPARQASARAAAAPGWFDRLYEEGQRRNAALKTLTARFSEVTTSTLLTRPLTARGTLAVERPSRVVLRYTEPDTRVIVIDDKKLTTSWPSAHVIDISTAMGRIQKQFVNGSASDLRREFDIDDRRPSDIAGTYYLSMTPKRKQILEALTRLDLWVDHDSLLLHAMRMTFASGESKTMTFEDVVPNATLPTGTFTPGR